MITQTRPAYFSAKRYAEYDGLSTDNKSTISAKNGDKFYEIDTGKKYVFNVENNEWTEQPGATSGGIDSGIPPITSESAGHFLSNDGSVTRWQELASADFIIHLTDNLNGSYTANRTYTEIKWAYDSKENIAVELDFARLPLMNAQFSNDEAGFTFGYTQVTTDGQLVTTRAIHYHHISDEEDEWTDADQTGEYLKITGGALDGNLSLGNNNITDVQELKIDGQYPLYLGNVIHTIGTPGVRITCTTNNEAAVVSADSQSAFKPINVGNPTADQHAVTLGYLTEGLKDDTATKNRVTLERSSGSTYSLRDGVYLLTACDTIHRGLTCVYMCGDTTTVYDLSGMAGWTVSKGAVTNSIRIDNKSDVQRLDVYIVAIGASSAI